MIMARANDSPAQAIKGRLLFMPFVPDILHKPVVLTSKPTANGKSDLTFSVKQIVEMQK
jgi:hypothetical protein